MNVPITREVKNPRASLTTIAVFLICLARSSARCSVCSEVCSPLMISSIGLGGTKLAPKVTGSIPAVRLIST